MLRSAVAGDLGVDSRFREAVVETGSGDRGPRDLGGAGAVTEACRAIAEKTPWKARKHKNLELDEIADVRDPVLAALADEPPVNLADLGVIRDGFDPRLDELRDISKNSKTYLAQIEQRERSREFNIGSLKVRFNNVFGY